MKYKYVFLDVLSQLIPISNDIMLVGGWVPTVFFEYLWKNTDNPFVTKDVDIGLSQDISLDKTIESEIDHSRFKHKHLRLGHDRPYQLLYNSIPIDFLADEDSIQMISEKVLGQGILINPAKDYKFLFEDCIEVDCDEFRIKVPHPARYILHKMQVYFSNKDYRKKDIAVSYYTLSRTPNQKEILNEMHKLKESAAYLDVVRNLVRYAKNNDSFAVLDIQNAFSEIGIYEDASDILSVLEKMCC